MRKTIRKGLCLLLLALLALGTAFGQGTSKQPVELTIIETSDLHGAMIPYDFKTQKPKESSLANVAALVARERQKGEILLLDCGDNLQGQPVVYYYNFNNPKPVNPVSAMLNELGYDAVAVGNHDIETGHAVFDKVNGELSGGFTCANLVRADNGQPYFKPYTVVTKKGLKIAILGLVEPAFVKNFPEVLYSGIKVEDMVESAAKWVPVIREKEKPDVLIGLFHAGVDYTYGGYKIDSYMNENPSQLIAQSVPGIDLVLVGHDHQGWDGKGYDPVTKAKINVVGPSGKVVPIYGALNEARRFPLITMNATWNANAGKWDLLFTGGLAEGKEYAPDEAFVKKFDSYRTEAASWLSKPIGRMKGTITTRDSMFGDSAFVDLIHDLQLALTKDPGSGLKPAQVSFCAPLSTNAVLPSRQDGVITVADMFTLYVYENWLYTMTLTGEQIDGFLEESYGGWMDVMKDESGHLLAFAMTADGKIDMDPRYNTARTKTATYNYDSAQGITYTVDVTKPKGDRVAISAMSDGAAFEPSKTYTVAINSYRAMGGGGLLERGAKIPSANLLAMTYVTSATTKDLRFYLTEWFEKQGSAVTEPAADGNWKVIPESFAAAGKARDLPLMYPNP